MRRRLLVGTAAVLAVALAAWLYLRLRPVATNDDIIEASGRVEMREVRVGSATGGRVVDLLVAEGDVVLAGQILARLDARAAEADVSGAGAAAAAAAAAAAGIDRQIAALEAQLAQARREAARYRRLYEGDAAPRQVAEQAEANVERLENERGALQAARRAAERQTEAAEARLRAARVHLDEAVVVAPRGGVVDLVLTRAGEIAYPGAPLLVLRRVEAPLLTVYLTLRDAERVAVGTEARVYPAELPEATLRGIIERVSERAEFTPRDIHMPDERSTLVFAVDIRVPGGGALLKDGFPADVQIRAREGAPWPERK